MLRDGASDSDRGFAGVRHVPGVKGFPLIGNFFDLVQNFDQFLHKQYKTYGPLSRMGLVGHDALLALGPELAEELFLNRERIYSNKQGYRDSLGLFYPGGLLLHDFEEHRHHRRFAQAAFKNTILQEHLKIMNTVFTTHLASWKTEKDILFYPRIKNILLDVAAKIFLGFDELGDKTNLINEAFVNVTEGMLSIFLVDMPGFKYHRAMNGKRLLDHFMYTMIDERRKNPKSDMFSQLCIEKDDDGNYLADDEIVAAINFLMFAAHDTTSSALAHMVLLLSTNSEWQERLRDESRSFGKEVLEFNDLDKLPDLQLVFMETLRLYPSAPILARATLKECTLAGYTVPKNTYINFCPVFNHHMEEWWSNPEEFDPERFSPERAEHKRHAFSYVPFGGGVHKCIGMHFAKMQTMAFMHVLLQQYRFKTAIDYVPQLQAIPLPKPKDDLPIVIERIQHQVRIKTQ